MSTSFQTHILPLFRQKDILCMGNLNVRLNDYGFMSDETGDAAYADHANARHVLAHLIGDELPQMPPRGPFWSAEQLNLLRDWINSGCAP